ncbi:MAG TPA: hypothetical protein DCE42_27400 [Myxococcales bacterium]|nr:hypothetical protein [Deltaproteobacteria bacterium]HAA58519.1 hypothetical protein [Myxococcales bacterium]|tara:strand:+ start:16345 stop:18492 length:2148 start_codon:yes stop_codon:yes gene_type:complete
MSTGNTPFKEALSRVQERDQELGEELKKELDVYTGQNKPVLEILTPTRSLQPTPEVLTPIPEGTPYLPVGLDLETIVYRTGRPVLRVYRDEAELKFQDPESATWKTRLQEASKYLKKAIPAVGRIELQGHRRDWAGTGWLVTPDIIVTNRHVASAFAVERNGAFSFGRGFRGGAVKARIDFLEEFENPREAHFDLVRILHIEGKKGPDLAFLQVKPCEREPISLSQQGPKQKKNIAIIGYPARDLRLPDQELMEKLFGNIYNKKRLAPGMVMNVTPTYFEHDASTLGGNSGSVVLDLETGQAVGIHFAGRFLKANYAVPSTLISERLHQISQGATIHSPGERIMVEKPTETPFTTTAHPESNAITLTIPINVTIQVGDTQTALAPQPTPPSPTPATAPSTTPPSSTAPNEPPIQGGLPSFPEKDEKASVFSEGSKADEYKSRRGVRQGYKADFLGDTFNVPLPAFTKHEEDILTFDFDGEEGLSVLDYQHFSVVMNKHRRMCFYSAVNISGSKSKKKKRTGWRYDPRIPREYQIRKECYGNPPKFSRGHMTRREDPVWGSDAAAKRGNDDSMHVTNAVPQMQPFNAGIWLRLEDYALDHAREDDMNISVFTGPVFQEDDPFRYDIQIPVLFWKIIVFQHDETGKLTATGYSMSQEDYLQEEEFVFGAHKTYQQSIAWIEQKTGLSFGELSEHDPMKIQTESATLALQDPSEIIFI